MQKMAMVDLECIRVHALPLGARSPAHRSHPVRLLAAQQVKMLVTLR